MHQVNISMLQQIFSASGFPKGDPTWFSRRHIQFFFVNYPVKAHAVKPDNGTIIK